MAAQRSNPAQLDDASIAVLVAAASGDSVVRERLLSRFRPEVVRSREAQLDNGTAMWPREDIAFDVCRAVMEALPADDQEYGSFWSVVFSMASRSDSDARDVDDGRQAGDLAARLPEARTATAREEDPAPHRPGAAPPSDLLDRLPAHQRLILLLKVQGELTTLETAHVLGLTPASVRVAQHRAMMAIRRARGSSPSSPGAGPTGSVRTD